MRYDIDILGDDKLRRELDDLGEKVTDLKPVFHAILRTIILPMNRRQFGEGWAPLSPATVETKARKGLDPRIMRATGALHAALTSEGPGRIRTVGKSTLRYGVGAKLFYARMQHFGTKNIPARPLTGWERGDESRALKMLDRYLFS